MWSNRVSLNHGHMCFKYVMKWAGFESIGNGLEYNIKPLFKNNFKLTTDMINAFISIFQWL